MKKVLVLTAALLAATSWMSYANATGSGSFGQFSGSAEVHNNATSNTWAPTADYANGWSRGRAWTGSSVGSNPLHANSWWGGRARSWDRASGNSGVISGSYSGVFGEGNASVTRNNHTHGVAGNSSAEGLQEGVASSTGLTGYNATHGRVHVSNWGSLEARNGHVTGNVGFAGIARNRTTSFGSGPNSSADANSYSGVSGSASVSQ